MDELLIDHVAVFKEEDNPHSVFLAEEFKHKFEEAGGRVEPVSITDARGDLEATVRGLKEKGLALLLPAVECGGCGRG